MAYLALYRSAEKVDPDAFCLGVRVLDDELELVCDNVLNQSEYKGWCIAKVVHQPRDLEDFEYLVNLSVPHGMHPEEGAGKIRLKMASRASKKQAMRAANGMTLENEGARLDEALGGDISEKIMVLDYAKRAQPLTISLASRPMGALSEFMAKTGEFDVQRNSVMQARHLSKGDKKSKLDQIAFAEVEYTKALLSELILDLVVDEDISDEEIEALTKRHLRYMNVGDMQSLIMGIILGQEPDEKKAEALNAHVVELMGQNLKDMTGTEQSPVLPDIMDSVPSTLEQNLQPNSSLNTSSILPNGNTEGTLASHS